MTSGPLAAPSWAVPEGTCLPVYALRRMIPVTELQIYSVFSVVFGKNLTDRVMEEKAEGTSSPSLCKDLRHSRQKRKDVQFF